MDKNEENILIEDGQVQIKLGKTAILVDGLCIKASVKWTKEVKTAWYEQAQKNMAVIKASTDLSKTDEEKIQAVEKAMEDGAGDDLLTVCTFLRNYNPSVLTEELIDSANAQQIVTAFKKVYELENPMQRLIAAMSV